MKTKDIDDLIKIVEVISQINIPNYIISINSDEIIKTLEDVKLILPDVTKRFVLLKGKGGHVFWTTNLGDIDNDFNEILFESDIQDEIIEQWEKHNPNVW